jgi:ATP-binding cassette subfamily B protein
MIIILENGQVAAVGNHDQLMQSSTIYQEVFYSQQKGGIE